MEKAGGYPAPKSLLLTAALIPHSSFDRFTYSEALILASFFLSFLFMFSKCANERFANALYAYLTNVDSRTNIVRLSGA